MNDPYFKEELDAMKLDKPKKKTKRGNDKSSDENEDEAQAEANLELLLMDDKAEETGRHFSMKKIEEREKEGKKKKKKKSMKNYKKKKLEEKRDAKNVQDGFEVCVYVTP